MGPRTREEEVLCRVWGEVLGLERVGVEENFFEVGGDSILSIQVVARAREEGVEITPKQMFERPTVRGLGEVAGRVGRVEAEQGQVRGKVELTPIQAGFFQWGLAKAEHYNQSVLLEVREGTDSERLERAVRALVEQHDVLRMRYEPAAGGGERAGGGGEWEQWCEDRMEEEGQRVLYERKKLKAESEEEWQDGLEADARRVQGSLRLRGGGLLRAVEYEREDEEEQEAGRAEGEKQEEEKKGEGGRRRRLLLVAHHLVVDGVSWRILLEDLERGYEQLGAGQEEIDLGAKTTSYQEWARRLKEYGEREEVRGELGYWLEQAGQKDKDKDKEQAGQGMIGTLPKDYEAAGEENVVGTQRSVVVRMEEEETRELLQGVPEVYHTQINDVLLAGLGRALGEWSGGERVLVDVEGHGREEVMEGVDVSRTVGWFTTIYPVVLGGEGRATGAWDVGRGLKETKERLRKVPRRGLGYGVLRYRLGDGGLGSSSETRQAEVRFNYLGQWRPGVWRDSELRVAGETRDRERGGEPASICAGGERVGEAGAIAAELELQREAAPERDC